MNSKKKQPNVVLYISHDTGRFISPYGYPTVTTPFLESLAGKAALFENAYCTTPLCAPARSALTTGQHHHENGMMGLPQDKLGGWDMVRTDRHLANQFAKGGYESVLCGFMHECKDFRAVGFERTLHGTGEGNNEGAKSLKGAESEIGDWLDRRKTNQPFYLQIGSHETHRDWDPGTSDSSRGIWKAPYLVDDPLIDEEMAAMQGATRTMDEALEGIYAEMEKRGLMEDTIFCITTDHGIDFPRAKGTLFDPGIEVFLFLQYSGGGWPEGRRFPQLISQIDLYPTLLEACGISVPEGSSGSSFLPLLTGEGEYRENEHIFAEKTYHDNYDPIRAVRTADNWKYVLNFDAQTLYDVRIATAPRYNWFRFPFKKDEREELYDIGRDPQEADNLVGRPEHQERLRHLRKVLATWMAKTNDPLLEGSVISPYHKRTSAHMKALSKDP